MALTYVTLYPPGGNSTTVQVVEGSQLHMIYADMGFSATPSAPGPPKRPDPFPQYVHDDEVGALVADAAVAATDPVVAGLVGDKGSQTGAALRAASVAAVTESGTFATAAALTSVRADVSRGVPANRASVLRPFWAAVANRDNAPVRIACIGDSVTEGQGATAIGKRWTSRLGKQLHARLPVTGLAASSFEHLGGWDAQSSFTSVTLGGTINTNYGKAFSYGLPLRNLRILTNTTGSLTFTFTGTSFQIIYTAGPITGKLNIVIDGGAATVVDTNGSLVRGARWTSSVLAATSHTVTVTMDSTTAASRELIIEGIATYNGDENKGFHVYNGGHYGYAVSQYQGQLTNNLPPIAPDLTLLELGLNDKNSISATQFQTNLTSLVSEAAAAMTTASKPPAIVLVATYNPYNAPTWPDYVAAMNAVAAARSDTVVFDLRDRMPEITSEGAAAATYNLYSDQTHPSDKGYALIADALATYLVPA